MLHFPRGPRRDILLDRMLAAAERGVLVRLLIGDMYTVGKDRTIAAPSSHPDIEIRAFNPFAGRSAHNRVFGWTTDFSRGNRRMHNKETFDSATDPRYTFRLASWPAPSSTGETPSEEVVRITEEGGKEVVSRSEPYASLRRRLSVGLHPLLAPESLL